MVGTHFRMKHAIALYVYGKSFNRETSVRTDEGFRVVVHPSKLARWCLLTEYRRRGT